MTKLVDARGLQQSGGNPSQARENSSTIEKSRWSARTEPMKHFEIERDRPVAQPILYPSLESSGSEQRVEQAEERVMAIQRHMVEDRDRRINDRHIEQSARNGARRRESAWLRPSASPNPTSGGKITESTVQIAVLRNATPEHGILKHDGVIIGEADELLGRSQPVPSHEAERRDLDHLIDGEDAHITQRGERQSSRALAARASCETREIHLKGTSRVCIDATAPLPRARERAGVRGSKTSSATRRKGGRRGPISCDAR